ncbi:MAG TPA: PilT/PilU family type 4a pilus ATPase [Polyangia bacterium]|nr:PilT/PilU family type 4a pilus ATPase [Polyangia bacterium]
MAGIDGILSIAVQHAADELRLATDQPPRIFKKGAPIRLSIPETSDETLRYLLGGLLTGEREAALETGGRVELPYSAGDGTAYHVTLSLRGRVLEAVFQRGPRAARPSAATSAAATSAPSTSAPSTSAANAGATSASALGASTPNASASKAIAPNTSAQNANAASASASHAANEISADAISSGAVSSSAGGASETPSAELHALLARAITLRASDVHLLDGEPPSLRVDGRLRALADLEPADVARLLAPSLGAAERAALDAGRSLDLALSADGLGRFRLNVYRAQGRLAAALRVLPRSAPALSELHLPVALDDLVDVPHGLVLVCGATGSGKSATLAALAGEALRRHSPLVITLEDPIEYLLQPPPGSTGLVRQRQIGRDARDFPTGLRDALREDPDLLLIGEMRDADSIALALTAAETGHLVLASLHSRSATSAVERIVDAYPPERQQQIRVQLADALRAVVAQRLLPRARGQGRLPAVEVMRRTTNVASLIREGKSAQLPTAIQAGRKEGMIPLEACLAELVRSGQVDRESARAAANDPTSLASYLQS